MRSVRRWSYEMFKFERAVRFVVMVTPEDLKANAEYIKMADHYVPVPGGTNNNNYANVELIVDIAVRCQVQVSLCTISPSQIVLRDHLTSIYLCFLFVSVLRLCGPVGVMLQKIRNFPIYWERIILHLLGRPRRPCGHSEIKLRLHWWHKLLKFLLYLGRDPVSILKIMYIYETRLYGTVQFSMHPNKAFKT